MNENMTVGEAAQALGLRTYDTALPQDWVDDVKRVTGTYPAGMFVWCYDHARSFGEPFPLTPLAVHILITYTANKGINS